MVFKFRFAEEKNKYENQNFKHRLFYTGNHMDCGVLDLVSLGKEHGHWDNMALCGYCGAHNCVEVARKGKVNFVLPGESRNGQVPA